MALVSPAHSHPCIWFILISQSSAWAATEESAQICTWTLSTRYVRNKTILLEELTGHKLNHYHRFVKSHALSWEHFFCICFAIRGSETKEKESLFSLVQSLRPSWVDSICPARWMFARYEGRESADRASCSVTRETGNGKACNTIIQQIEINKKHEYSTSYIVFYNIFIESRHHGKPQKMAEPTIYLLSCLSAIIMSAVLPERWADTKCF